ncbi:O-antigen ligase family protein [Halomonas sabkhae]|uniref:O-antigen ligase family protein n=1 Tax=Halomonas sabkhae TaxID=626223 RepID=UPI0025B55121|nr:O-antigen ligase family protein [Halomonas sabkhae]MDN3525033.1 O-antigen ligase family protein [Halomonas sabkhae]
MSPTRLLRWETRHLGSTPALLVELGVLSTLLYAFTKVHFDAVGSLAKGALILVSLTALTLYGRPVWRHTAFRFLGIALGFAILHWLFIWMTLESLARDYPKLDHMARLFIFLLLAWWLAGSTRNTLIFWGIAALAVVSSPWIAGDGLNDFQRGFAGQRIGFGIRNVQHAAMFFGTALLGLLIFLPRLLQARGRYWMLPLWALALSVLVAGVLIAQTRATWLGLMVAASLLMAGLLWHHRRRIRYLPLLVLLSIAGGGYLLVSNPVFMERLTAEADVIHQLLQGNWDAVPLSTESNRSSIGERLYSWRGAWEMILQRPLLGWGDNGVTWLFDNIDYNQAHYQNLDFGHLHNLYIEISLQYGLIGLVGYFGLLGWLVRHSLKAWQAGRMPGDIMVFTLTFVVFWSVVNLFESYWFFWTGALLFNLVVAGSLTHIWAPSLPGQAQESHR